MTVNILAAMIVALLASLGSSGAAVAQQGTCLSKQDIQDRLTRGDIAPLADAMTRAGVKGRPLSVQVCDVNGSDHYIVNMMDSDGESQSLTLNAEDGSK
ncbi:MAG: hypothetical protein EOP19_00335 [Hyphomicrobiales bacterium]|nr:MAG: hypothetical protein EOP19_00335 [Hyphomicrobiales bacterium]